MYSIGVKSRFNLLHLQEGEEYIKDFQGTFKFYNPETNSDVSESGTIHFCSRSLILEPETNSMPLFKYLFKHIKKSPELTSYKASKAMVIHCTRLITVIVGKTPQPHKRYELETNANMRVEITLSYSSITQLLDSVENLYAESKKNLTDTDYKIMINEFMMDEERFGKIVFDKTRIKDISEMPLISKEIKVSQILPLVQNDGLFYLTDKRIYFQPLHSFYAKPLVSFKIKNIIGLYKRRYKLRHVLLNIIF